MKTIIFLFSTLAIVSFSCTKEASSTDKTLAMQTSPSDGQASFVTQNDSEPSWSNIAAYSNQNVRGELPITTSTNAGAVITSRTYLSFNLNQIPSKASIVSAKLSLYGMPSYFTTPQGNVGDNAIYIQRVTDNWNETTITWNSQPSTTSEGQVIVPGTITRYNYNLTDVDVTLLVREMKASTPDKTAGFCLKLKSENPTNTMVFASNRNEDAAKRPKLVVVYKE